MWKAGQNQSESPPPTVASPGGPSSGVARLGPSIRVKGTLQGDEDLLIEGKVEGEVSLNGRKVTIGEKGVVKADVHGSSICVEGEVKGNLFGEEQVVIRQSGKVRGNVTAPRVNLENGAKFRGAIDMQPEATAAAEASSRSSARRSRAQRSQGAGVAAGQAGG